MEIPRQGAVRAVVRRAHIKVCCRPFPLPKKIRSRPEEWGGSVVRGSPVGRLELAYRADEELVVLGNVDHIGRFEVHVGGHRLLVVDLG